MAVAVFGGDKPAPLSQRVELDVTGMSCASCADRVQRQLTKVDGVVHASVNYATRVATIDGAETISHDQLCEAVRRAGYDAVPRAPLPDTETDPDAAQARVLFRRFVVAVVLFVPLAHLSVMFAAVPSTRFIGWGCVLVGLAAPVVTWAAYPFHRAAIANLRHGAVSMETLISTGIIASTMWSLYTIFVRPHPPAARGVWQAIAGSDAIYLEVAAGVTVFVLAGRYFEAKAKSRAGGALRALAALSAKDVSVLLPDGTEQLVPVSELQEQQQFVVRPGQTIAADGLVVAGEAAVDVSTMTGEARPIDIGPGASVLGGTIALNGRLVIEAAAVGPDTKFASMVRLVEQAQSGKATAQRLADRIAGVFVPCVFVIAMATLAGWLLVGGGVDHAVSAALAVLVIACPCALGLATPTALMVASGRGAFLGIFLKGPQALDATRNVDTVVFDKTGTLTSGRLQVTSVTAAPGWEPAAILAMAAAVEAGSEHPVSLAIVNDHQDTATLAHAEGFRAVIGRGALADVDGRQVKVGKPSWVGRRQRVPTQIDDARRAAEFQGQTVVFVAVDDQVCGAIAVADAVKDSAASAVARLREHGLGTLLVTGDNAITAQAIADQAGIDDVIADVLPDGKVDVIEQLRAQGRRVAMVGDGINDGPALAAADLGLAIGRGTDVAIGAADIILVRDDLNTVPLALELARATLRTIRGNMLWAFGYNVAAIPVAAVGLLNPLFASAAMAFSSFFVVSNSLRLRRFAAAPQDSSPSSASLS
jgi:P-type Cu+ transporter